MTLYSQSLEAMERELFLRVLTECKWNLCFTSEKLGIERSTLRKKLKQYGMKKPEGIGQVRRALTKPRRPRHMFPDNSITGTIREVVEKANGRLR